MSDVAIGERFAQANPAPGYPAQVIEITGVDGKWAYWQDWRAQPPRPVQVASLLNSALWLRMPALTGKQERHG